MKARGRFCSTLSNSACFGNAGRIVSSRATHVCSLKAVGRPLDQQAEVTPLLTFDDTNLVEDWPSPCFAFDSGFKRTLKAAMYPASCCLKTCFDRFLQECARDLEEGTSLVREFASDQRYP